MTQLRLPLRDVPKPRQWYYDRWQTYSENLPFRIVKGIIDSVLDREAAETW